MKKVKKNKLEKIALVLFFLIIILDRFNIKIVQENKNANEEINASISYETSNIPEYNGDIYVIINDNIPSFTDEDMNIDEHYSNLKDKRVRNSNNKN